MKDLTAQAKVLADRVGALSVAVEKLDERSTRNERIAVGVMAGLVLCLILTSAVVFVLVQLQDNNRRIEAVIDRELQTRQDALCPLYSLILGNYNPESRPEGEARDRYNEQFEVMRGAYQALDCQQPLVPPATRPTTGGTR